ncbi:MAG: O-antigen ligase family protein [Chloroflexi bacterium]|nr:O-antigen ligase family protein [Chloroflexota bacterium]
MEIHLSDDRARIWISALVFGILIALAGGALIAFVHPLVPFAIIVGLVIAGIILSRIELALYAVIAVAVLLPFGALPLNVGFNPTFLDLALLAVFGLWLLQVLTRQTGAFIATPLAAPMLTFIVLAIFSFIAGLAYSAMTAQGLRQFAEILISIALFFVVVNTVRTRAQVETVIRVVIVAGFISALIGIFLYVIPRELAAFLLSLLRVFKYPTGDRVLRFIEDDPTQPLRAISTSVDPNVLGGLLILVTALTIPQLFAARPLFARNALRAMLAAMAVCLFLTFSRNALLAVTIAILFMVYLQLARRIHALPAAILVFIGAPLIALAGFALLNYLPFTQTYAAHLIEGLQGQDRATLMRFGEYKDAFTLIARYPFFGVGFGSSPDIDTYIGVSSVYLLMAEEMGIIGLSVFLGVMILFFAAATRAWFAWTARDETLAPILLGLIAALVGAMIGGIFDHYFFNLKFPHSVALFWLYVALGMAVLRLRDDDRR